MHTEIIATPKCVEAQQTTYDWLDKTTRGTVRRFKAWLEARHQRRLNRQAFKQLLTLDDKVLRDIGLTRADVIEASSLPLSQNAAVELETISNTNRRRR